MKTFFHALALGAVFATGVTSLASAQTLGDRVTAGKMSNRAFDQLIAHTGLSRDQAATLTLNQIVHLKLADD